MDFLLFSLSIGMFGTLFFALFVVFALRKPDFKAAHYMAGAFFCGVATLGLYEIIDFLERWNLRHLIEASLWLGTLLVTMALGERVGWKPRWSTNLAMFAFGLIMLTLVPRLWKYAILDIAQAVVLCQIILPFFKQRTSVINKITFWFIICSILFLIVRAATAVFDIYPAIFNSTQEFHLALTMLSTALFGLITGNIVCFSIAYDIIQIHSSAAMTDPLTGLLNRRGMAEITECEGDKGRQIDVSGRAILIFDIDYFKSINDEYGHEVGDEVLIKIAATVADLIKYHGHCARTGGEEFSILFNSESTAAAFVVSEHLRVAIALITHENLPHDRKVTVSMGLAFVREGEAMKRATRRADAALYAAKDAGRNRLRIADGDNLPDSVDSMSLPNAQVSHYNLARANKTLRGLG
jgi:diguanylate cyclase (GGDEF)-like protein